MPVRARRRNGFFGQEPGASKQKSLRAPPPARLLPPTSRLLPPASCLVSNYCRLLRDLLAGASDAMMHASLRRATSDAAALAWTTSFPLLVLPELVREKADSARRYVRRQAALLKRQ